MIKFAFIGAGSLIFTRNLVRDILSFPALSDCTLALMDNNEERLSYIKKAVDKIVAAGNYKAKVVATTNRIEALKGASGVICTILAGGVQVWRHDIEIPKKYGVDINIGDTRGPSGIFRALRTIPVILDICSDIERHCPDALLLNYTNPMAMLCRAMQEVTKIKLTGLCHSVQGTAEMLADWIGASGDEVSYKCAGINHQAWFLEYKRNGVDAYPEIRKAVNSPEIYNIEQVRNEMFLHLGYYVTESSGHNSEYNPWFRKRKDLLEKYCTDGTGWNPGRHGFALKNYLRKEIIWKDMLEDFQKEKIDLARGKEYASNIFNALYGDHEEFEFNGNLRNFGLIDNLPEGCCVEVPVTASSKGLEPAKVGSLPDHLAALNYINAMCEEMAVKGALTGDRDCIYHAAYLDPLTSAVLSLSEIRKMVDEMFEVNKDWLSRFNSAQTLKIN